MDGRRDLAKATPKSAISDVGEKELVVYIKDNQINNIKSAGH